ncbi:MAG: FAD-binding oxidoreductase [Kordiimonadaceae bacterium]|nr:FAD-binding oxidoreductase [Kordiimonadaceae bacterium]MBO6568346.1 FAD-binding oxidoreductase [Kordiimonadaceae bacterium]MBO6963924.1 FAD-binding oxidoreductase [Kordiimonadaceae bacterium]
MKPSATLDRRKLLQLVAASAAASASLPVSAKKAPRVAVVGGGIIGTSIAYHLTKAGADVTLLERHELATRASRGTFAWINATWAKQPRHYHTFSQMGVAGWHRLERELDIPVRWEGSLEWFGNADRQARLRDQIAEQVLWGEPARMVPAAELAGLEPLVDFNGAPDVAFSPNDGAVDPVLAASTLANAAMTAGGKIVTNCSVEDIEQTGASMKVYTNCGTFDVDKVVLATGADPVATERFAGINIPQRSTPGVIVVTKPYQQILNRIVAAPGVHLHQRLDGRIVLGEQDGAPQTEAHAERLKNRPNRFPEEAFAEMHASRIMSVAEQFLPDISGAEVEDVYIGWRPLPLDGHPVIGQSPARPNVYLAITHSGVTLAPIIGELAAKEVVSGRTLDVLSPYRTFRCFEHVARY